MIIMEPPLAQGNTDRVQAAVIAVGLLTVVSVGVVGCIAAILTVFYFAVQLILILLQSIIGTFAEIASVWGSAAPLLKLLILAVLIYGGYRVYQWRQAKRGMP